MGDLPAALRTVVLLRLVDSMSSKDMATALDVSDRLIRKKTAPGPIIDQKAHGDDYGVKSAGFIDACCVTGMKPIHFICLHQEPIQKESTWHGMSMSMPPQAPCQSLQRLFIQHIQRLDPDVASHQAGIDFSQ